MLVNGDKLVVKKRIAGFLDEGDIVKVTDVNDKGMISFAFGEGFIHKGLMNYTECEEHFEKLDVENVLPALTEERIDEILEDAEVEVYTAFNKCTILSVKLPNGFMITESYTTPPSEEHDKDFNIEVCWSRIEDKLWELERYRLQEEMYRENLERMSWISFHDCEDEDEEELEDELDEDEELDCEECDDYSCPSHPFNSNT